MSLDENIEGLAKFKVGAYCAGCGYMVRVQKSWTSKTKCPSCGVRGKLLNNLPRWAKNDGWKLLKE